jgi:hypothetical protein
MTTTAPPLLRPLWRRARLWVGLAVLLVGAGFAVAAIRPAPGRALDPASPAPGGSKALATVLRGYGVTIDTGTSAASARGRVLVAEPETYTGEQLRALSKRAELVLLGASEHQLAALGLAARPVTMRQGDTAAACGWPAAAATGPVELPPGTIGYAGTGTSCYGGALLLTGRVTLLGSPALVRNGTVARTGVAALAINALTDGLRDRSLTWLLPGPDATAGAAPTAWALFPDGARRAAFALLAVGGLLVLWRGRRFGRPVREPLPVLVRASELTEGHGRLYARAHARDRAAAALRSGFAARAGAVLGLPPGAAPHELAAAVAERTRRDPASVAALLAATVPADDAELRRLGVELARLERELRPEGSFA